MTKLTLMGGVLEKQLSRFVLQILFKHKATVARGHLALSSFVYPFIHTKPCYISQHNVSLFSIC